MMPKKNLKPEQLSQLVELLPRASSLREISREMNERLETVRIVALPLIAIMQAQGILPPCVCGKVRFHPYGCSVRAAKHQPSSNLPGHTALESMVLLARRVAIIDALVAGRRFCEINDDIGLPNRDSRHYMRFLTPAQLVERELRLAARGPMPRLRKSSIEQAKEARA